MVSNFLLAVYKEKNPQHIFEKDNMLLQYHGSDYWNKLEKFIHMFEYYFPKLLTIEALNGTWLWIF